ncbi:MAG: YkgJ family cysteine cluster protein, partial [Desulfobacterales bacterium]
MTENRKLSPEDTFRFDCHPGVACFTRCCKDADMYLYPYDIIRMKHYLGIPSDQFLAQYTIQAFRDNPYFPNVMLKMSDTAEKPCLFLSSDGCSIYQDRPFSCRAYPIERAVARTGEEERTAIHFLSNHAYCLGHQESKAWTVQAWIED